MGFARGTLIKTENGYKKIEDVEVGDMVLTHKGRYRMVRAKEESIDDDLREVSYIDEACWYCVMCDKEQEFYVFDKKGKDISKKARGLGKGDMVVGLDDGNKVYFDMHYVIDAGSGVVYKLKVDEDGSFVVTWRNVVVRCEEEK